MSSNPQREMGHLFSKKEKKPPSRITEQDEAVLQLKGQRDKLKQYQKRIELSLEKEKEIARQLLKDGRKDKAKLLLKKKRFEEQLIERTTTQLDNIERMIHDVEFAQIEMKVLEGLKSGNECLHKMHEVLSIENVERILVETQESVEYQREIDSLISGGLSDTDDTDIENELMDMLAEEEKDVHLPEVPTDQLPERDRVKEKPIASKPAEPLLA